MFKKCIFFNVHKKVHKKQGVSRKAAMKTGIPGLNASLGVPFLRLSWRLCGFARKSGSL